MITGLQKLKCIAYLKYLGFLLTILAIKIVLAEDNNVDQDQFQRIQSFTEGVENFSIWCWFCAAVAIGFGFWIYLKMRDHLYTGVKLYILPSVVALGVYQISLYGIFQIFIPEPFKVLTTKPYEIALVIQDLLNVWMYSSLAVLALLPILILLIRKHV